MGLGGDHFADDSDPRNCVCVSSMSYFYIYTYSIYIMVSLRNQRSFLVIIPELPPKFVPEFPRSKNYLHKFILPYNKVKLRFTTKQAHHGSSHHYGRQCQG